ncbi:hypothetical protein RclHR1_20420003 [Rhizophagus clarus]|uniref:Uncharacterized protein n=1 Tax=Rhizophagus clarus TaxID=94130 RepID=A0A2Z6QQK9_9GLOM|nr:hypothetical protein RclHR1_20420003 [Rhizophagus clarus]
MLVWNSFRGRLYDISKVWKKWTELFQRSRTSLRADYDISKSRTPLEVNYCSEEADCGISKVQNSKWTEDGLYLAADQVSFQR